MQKINYFAIKLIALLLVSLFLATPFTPVFADEELIDDSTPVAGGKVLEKEITNQEDKLSLPSNSESLEDAIDTDKETSESGSGENNSDENSEDGTPPEAESSSSLFSQGANPSSDKGGLSAPVMPQIDENTGSLVYDYSIIVPPGRNGLQPDLKLVYNSGNRDVNDVFGSGWSINIPYIQRINKKGSENLYGSESDGYFYSSFDSELTLVGGSSYRAKTEEGNFNAYSFSGNSWLVTAKDGTTYKFGYQEASRQNNLNAVNDVYRWMLEEIRDTNNNYIKYVYYKDAGQIYPSSIVYTGHNATDGIFQVDFTRFANTYATPSYDSGFSVTTNYYISEIQAKVNGVWVNKYALSYATSPSSNKFFLTSVIASGQDSNSNVVTLPATTFAYQQNSAGWTINGNWSFPSLPFGETSWSWPSISPQFTDLNGDGWIDMLLAAYRYNNGNIYTYYRYLNNGSGWTSTSSWAFPSLPAGETNWLYPDTPPQFTDFNGDGLPDLLIAASHYNSGNVITYYRYLNTGSGWSQTSSFAFPALPAGETNWLYPTISPYLVDLNGDGLSDLIIGASHYNNGNVMKYYQYLNTGSAWLQTALWNFPALPPGEQNWQYFSYPLLFTDLNSDGLNDILLLASRYNSGNIYTYYRYLNTGSGWSLTSNWNFPSLPPGETNWLYPSIMPQFTDMDGDDLPDLILGASHYNQGNINKYYSYLNTGSGWTISSSWNLPTPLPPGEQNWQYFSYSPQFADLNADGLSDPILPASHYSSGNILTYYRYLNNGPKEDLLAQATYPQGGNTAIVYKNAAQYASTESRNYPYPIFTVQQITNSDGAGLSRTIDYNYQGGQYYFNNAFDRKFSGYNYIAITNSVGNLTKTFYHTGKGNNSSAGQYNDNGFKIGKVYRVENYDNSSNLYKLIVNKWDHYDLGSGAGFVKILRSTEFTYDGLLSHKDKSETYVYNDANGNLTEKVQWGQVTGGNDGSFADTGSDKRITSYTYTTIGPILSATVEMIDQSSNRINQQKLYYDSQALGTATLGNQTKVESWVTGTTYINSQKSYTSKGSVQTETDPRSKVTTYTYDTYDLYPATVSNPLSQNTSYTYDYANGKPTQIIDVNNFVYQTSYDGFGRVKEEKIPGDSSPYTPVTKTTYAYTDTSGAFAIQKTDNLDASNNAVTYQYFDGLGRLIQTRTEDEASNTYNVEDVFYNNRSLVLKESLPYASIGSAKTIATSTTSLYTSYTYDPLERVIVITNTIGTISNAYDRWKTTITDLRGKTKDLYVDAYGNLIQVDEHNSSNTYATAYEYNGNNKLTKITDALSNVRNFTYDGLDRKLTAQDLHASADSTFGSWTYTYDNSGNLTSVVNSNSQTINYTYDDINRVLTEDHTGDEGTEVTYTYDTCTNGVGKLCSVTATGANDAYAYNSRGNVSSHTKTIDSTNYQTDYTYDRQGNQLEITNPDGSKVQYNYNSAGQLETVKRKESTDGSFISLITDFDYGPDGQIIYQAFANGAVTANTYDPFKLYRLTNKTTTIEGGSKIQDLTYTYDNNGNITKIVDASNTDSAKTVDYAYDDLNRMISAAATNVTPEQSTYTQIYSYDPIGNILTSNETIGQDPAVQSTYSYEGNQGSSYTNPHAVTSISDGVTTTTYSYDNNGNLTGDGVWVHAWDYNNRLTNSNNGISDITYAYDPSGQRVKLSSGVTITYYPTKYYNTDGITPQKHVFAGEQAIATVTGAEAAAYVRYISTDYLNSSNVITNSSGSVEELLDYYPYGKIRVDQQGGFSAQRKYIGQEYDADTGLNYLNARYYDSARGRFISQDPMFWSLPAELLADPQQLNSYSYARNNPIAYSDPTGKEAYSFSRPVKEKGFLSNFAHTGTLIVPMPNENLPGININSTCFDTSRPFVLGAFPVGKPFVNWHLTFQVNNSTDYGYAMEVYGAMKNGQQIPGVAITKINPPDGVTTEQLDKNIINTFNSASVDQGYYNPLGGRQQTGYSNSNNANTYLLKESGISQQQMNAIVDNLRKGGGKYAPGLGVSLTAPTYAQITSNTVTSVAEKVKNTISSFFSKK